MPNRYDVSIAGIEYRLKRGEGSYQQGASRAMIDFQEIETMEGSQFTSRNDVRSLFQTSWAGGARWEKPLLSSATIDSYYTSDDYDMLIEPGSLLPQQIAGAATVTYGENHSKWVQVDYKTAYAVGGDGGTYHKVIKWIDGTTSEITEHSNTVNAATIYDACWDQSASTLYILSSAGVEYCTPGSTQGNVTTTITGGQGSAIFMHLGDLHIYDGDKIHKIVTPLGTPAITVVFNDGHGDDWLSGVVHTATNRFLMPWSDTLAISTADGIYTVKNVAQQGTVIAYIYRVDRDAAGTDIGTPVATLDAGVIALDIFWSLGSLLISGTSDIGKLGANDSSVAAPRTAIYHMTQESLGTIGSPTGNNPTEFVFKMLFSSNMVLYMGGHSNVWAYDPIRGGLHMLHTDAALTNGHYNSGLINKSGLHFFHGSEDAGQKTVVLPYANNTTADSTPSLQSNYFDFSIPGEQKYVTEVTLMVDNIKSGETWTVSLEADDGSFVSVATFTTGATQKKVFSTPKAGYRFRYKLGYATTGAQATPSKVKGIMFRALSGEMVPFWQLTVDGTEARNVENEIVRPTDVFDNLKALRDNKTPVAFIDNYESDDRSDSASYTVRVHSVTISKEEPKESIVSVVLVGT